MINSNNNEQGLVLIVVVLSIVILAILALGYTFLLTSELKRTEFDERLAHSLSVSEAGVDKTEWLIQSGNLSDTIFSFTLNKDSSCTVIIEEGWKGR